MHTHFFLLIFLITRCRILSVKLTRIHTYISNFMANARLLVFIFAKMKKKSPTTIRVYILFTKTDFRTVYAVFFYMKTNPIFHFVCSHISIYILNDKLLSLFSRHLFHFSNRYLNYFSKNPTEASCHYIRMQADPSFMRGIYE